MKSDYRGRQLMALRRLQTQSMKINGVTVSAALLKSVLRAIDDHGERCWASAMTIGGEVGANERSVRRAFKALQSQKLITIEERIGQSSCISINWESVLTPGVLSEVGTQPTPGVQSGTPDISSTNPGRTVRNPGRSVRRNEKKRIVNEKKRINSEFVVPELLEVKEFWTANQLQGTADEFFYHYQTNGWTQGRHAKPIKDWKHAAHLWSHRNAEFAKAGFKGKSKAVNLGAGVNYAGATGAEDGKF